MGAKKQYFTLPELRYDFDALWPYMTEEQLRMHYEKHHQAYVNKANALVQKLHSARNSNKKLDMKAIAKALSFNVGGHVLHSLFWENLRPVEDKQKMPEDLKKMVYKDFGSISNLKDEFAEVAQTVEGSGWAALVYSKEAERLMTMQIEKHNSNLLPSFKILLVIDVWEHAYYLDYKNERGKFIQAFWKVVNWEEVERRLKKIS